MNCNCKDDCFLVKELEKGNAELEARINNLKDKFEYSENYGKRVQKERHRLVNDNAKLRDQLTNAKEIIREFVEWATWQGNSKCPNFKSIQDKAEQFLSEVQK